MIISLGTIIPFLEIQGYGTSVYMCNNVLRHNIQFLKTETSPNGHQ